MKSLAAAAVILSAVAAPSVSSAASVTVGYSTPFGSSQAQINLALAAQDAFLPGSAVTAQEDFEGFTACTGSNVNTCANGTVTSSAVGTFTGITPSHTGGGSQIAPFDKIVVREALSNPFGRFNVTPDGSKYLDSNDMNGISWSVLAPGSTYLTKIAFFLTDIDDVGNIQFTITVKDGQTVLATAPRTTASGDRKLHLVTLTFDGPTDNVVIKMVNGKGDGFGIDGIRLAAVPLPAGGLLLLAGLGGLALLRRRRAA